MFNPQTNAWGYRNEYDAGVVPDSSKRREELVPGILVPSNALIATIPPVVECKASDCSFETISDDNIELINAKTA